MPDKLLHYFRLEADELLSGLNQCLLALEAGGESASQVGRFLRLTHTLKGAARVVRRNDVAQEAHTMEEKLSPYRNTETPIPRELLDVLLQHLETITTHLRRLGAPSPELPRTDQAPETAQVQLIASDKDGPYEPSHIPMVDESFQSVRIDLREVDLLLTTLDEANTHVFAMKESAASLQGVEATATELWEILRFQTQAGIGQSSMYTARLAEKVDQLRVELSSIHRTIATRADQAERELNAALDHAHLLRLVPASSIFPLLERVARDASRALGKSVTVLFEGGETRLDAYILAELREALQHVVRNAITHGIESPERRHALGKPLTGTLQIAIKRQGERVAFLCRDDGQGLHLEAIRQALVQSGRVSTEQGAGLSTDELLAFVLEGGVSTAPSTSELSGRGVGLEIAREKVALLKGELDLQSVPNQGTTVTLEVPVSLASLHALVVKIENRSLALPLDAIQQVLRIPGTEIIHTASGRAVAVQEQVIPLFSLAALLGSTERSRPSQDFLFVVILHTHNRQIALEVGQPHNVRELIVRALPPLTPAAPLIAGAALDAEGKPILILDPKALSTALPHEYKTPITAPSRPAPILIIDDSLTTRMLEQSILETAGYEVALAASAEEALQLVQDTTFGLFIVDVEMPGMDGFAFIEHTQRTPALRKIPSILVTSMDSAEHQRRGKQVGARAYIVKSEFNQDQFLNRVRSLIG